MISLKKGLLMNFIKKIRNIFLIFMACSFLGWIYDRKTIYKLPIDTYRL